jgi:hypothetical protein
MYGLYKIKTAEEKDSQDGSHSLAIPETRPSRGDNDANMKEEARSAMTQGTQPSSADDESENKASAGVKTQKHAHGKHRKHYHPSARKYERKSRHKSDGSHEHSKDKIEKGLRLAPAVDPLLLLNEEQGSRRERGAAQEDHDESQSSEQFDALGAVRASRGHATEVSEAMTLPSSERSKDKVAKGLRLAPAVEPLLLLNEEQGSRRERGATQEDHDEFQSSEEFDAPGAVRVSGGHTTVVSEAMPLPSSESPTGTLIEAELANDTEEQRQRQLEARTIRLEQQVQDFRRQQDGAVVVAVEHVETAEASETKRHTFLWYCTIIILVAIAIAGGVTAGILLKKEESTTDATPTNSPVVATLTPDLPTTPAPTTKHPTESPTESVPFYDPSSEEDCLAIANKNSVEDQHLLVAKALGIEFDVTLNGEQVVSSWLDYFTQKVQEYLALLLTGCLEETQQDVVAGDQGSTRHHRRLASNIRYVTANVIASGKYNIDQSCQAGAEQPCYRTSASLQLFLKGDETVSSLFNLITDLLESDKAESSMVERLDLPSLFKTVEIMGINDLNTESPSSQPSTIPSASPTDQPSTSPTTPLPTLDPTGKPTAPPTPHPTRRPTLLPTKGPTPNPSGLPTANPTKRPTPHPTQDPTPYPTRDPTGKPTAPPTPHPTKSPTFLPTKGPTPNPSRLPTSNPSRQPTRDPTLNPTLNKTRDPTPHPTSMPSFQPSKVCHDDKTFVNLFNSTCDWFERNEAPGCPEEGGAIGWCNVSGSESFLCTVRS